MLIMFICYVCSSPVEQHQDPLYWQALALAVFSSIRRESLHILPNRVGMWIGFIWLSIGTSGGLL